jgi:hypothetical protein
MIPIISALHALIILEDSITLSQIHEYAIFIRSHSYSCGFPPSFIRTELLDNDQSWSDSLRCSTRGATVFQPACTHLFAVTRQPMHVHRNTEARSCNNCCSGIAMSITYAECECVLVVSGIQHAMRMRHIFICGLSGSTLFFHFIS